MYKHSFIIFELSHAITTTYIKIPAKLYDNAIIEWKRYRSYSRNGLVLLNNRKFCV